MYGRESVAEGEKQYYYMHGNIVLKRIFRLKRGEIFTRCVASMSFVSEFAKVRKATVSFVISVCPYPTTRFPLDEVL